jgi:hypothetical protein
VDLLRGRGRPDPAPAPGADLGPARAHPGRAGVGQGLGPDLDGRAAGLPARAPRALLLPAGRPRGRKGERRSLSEADYAALLSAAHHQLHAPIILIWDNLNTHVSKRMQTFVTAHEDWLTVVRLPAYAPELNATEGVWSHLKRGLGNCAATNIDQLMAR